MTLTKIGSLTSLPFLLEKNFLLSIIDIDETFVFVNQKFCEMTQYNPEELIGKNQRILQPEIVDGMAPFRDDHLLIEGDFTQKKKKYLTKEGMFYWVRETTLFVRDESDQVTHLVLFGIDITNEMERTIENLQINENALKQASVVSMMNRQGIITYVNENFRERSQYPVEELIGQTHQMINSDFHPQSFFENLWETIEGGEMWNGDIKYRAKDESEYWINTTILPFVDKDQESFQYIVIGTDVTHSKETELRVQRMAYYDHLTGLPNRRYFQNEMEALLKKVASFAIIFIDLDRFKNINDSMGHSTGDQLLMAVGKRLKSCVRKGDIVVRFGGDEFVVLLPASDTTEAEIVANRIIEGMSEVIAVQNTELLIGASVGISLFPENGIDYDTLIKNADLAMYKAKENGGSNYQLFTGELQEGIIEKTVLEMELRQALEKGQFELHYHPKFDLKTKEITGAEALLRWRHPTKGIITPRHFISLAEETGLMIPIGKWVLETACAQAKEWEGNNALGLQISVNVSLQEFTHSFFVEQVREALNNARLNPRYLNLEITENITSEELNCKSAVHQLREIGVDVSIDDFGTGYSSLSSLSEFPITHLKIDRMFIQDLCKGNRAIIKTIVYLAKSLELKVIADGVETKEQEAFLLELNCDEVQGYYYTKPLAKKQFKAFLKSKRI